MLGPPLFFNEVQTGYMYTGAFVGALVGFAAAGLLADTVPRWLTRRSNGGVYEPEFRLPALVLVQLVLGCAGLYGFGVCSANTSRYGWFWPDFWFGCVVAGMVVGAVAASLYVVDAHSECSRSWLLLSGPVAALCLPSSSCLTRFIFGVVGSAGWKVYWVS